MANHKNIDREYLLDETEALFVIGVKKPYQIMRRLGIKNWATAKEYLRVAARRVGNRNKKLNLDRYFCNQVLAYDLAIKECWCVFSEADNSNAKIGALNALQKLLRGQAELLRLEPPKPVESNNNKEFSLYEIVQQLPQNEADYFVNKLNNARKQILANN
ncbi:MAG: hypothetical protein HYY86_02830 [Candidatus Harrisonbacteria bacterium]|nr:hypothetical protein [Candidatus Harrisonbacteria bacterium]